MHQVVFCISLESECHFPVMVVSDHGPERNNQFAIWWGGTWKFKFTL